jgi:hypothetical protein
LRSRSEEAQNKENRIDGRKLQAVSHDRHVLPCRNYFLINLQPRRKYHETRIRSIGRCLRYGTFRGGRVLRNTRGHILGRSSGSVKGSILACFPGFRGIQGIWYVGDTAPGKSVGSAKKGCNCSARPLNPSQGDFYGMIPIRRKGLCGGAEVSSYKRIKK